VETATILRRSSAAESESASECHLQCHMNNLVTQPDPIL